ncbi:MAG: DHH family phosphoesterase [Clostridiales bacterium]|nr:DHH family phosphoesterase [Clostridiales bacterium]
MNEIRDVEGLYNRYRQVPLYLIGMFCLMTVFMYFVGIVAGVIATIFTAIYGIINIVVFLRMNSLSRDRYVEFAMEHGKMQKELIKEFPVPYALLDEDGKLVWVNDEFSSITDTSKRKLMKLNIVQVFEEVTEESLPYEENVTEGEISFCGRKYRYEIRRVQVNKFEPVIDDVDGQNPVGEPVDDKPADDGDGVKRRGSSHHKTDTFLAFYMFDVTVVNRLTQENHDQKLVAGLIYIDNYDEIFESLEEVRHSLLVALVDRKINKYMANVDAIVKSLEKDKYMFVMPQKYLDQLKENKFALLDEVKAINIGNDLPLTLSISLGTDYKSFIENFEAARSAMELALGRGGDQAVIKSADRITYFGGKSQGTEKSTRVKARVKTLAFKELLETKERVIIMAHRNPDMDAFGSGIGIYKMVSALGKEAHIVVNEVSSAISPIYGNFTSSNVYPGDMIINSDQALGLIDDDTVVVVTDVNNPTLTECEELLAYAKSIVVFDHHRQTKDVIANATLSYIEPFASSACEMIAEMLQYMDEKIKLRPTEADAMYAGILIDTDNFLTKTGVRTFEAAAFLKRSGADVMRVRKMFRTDIATYRQKAEGVSHAEMVLDAFAISIITPEDGPESPVVLTAKIANEMLNIAGVRASFVIAQMGNDVRISARAIDDVNVQIIMERMGGGGHANIAAAQFENASAEDIKEELIELLNEMYKEGDI